MNFKIIIEYDGTAYHGWQRQKDDPTIQGEIEKAIFAMTGKAVSLIGSGRTDAGVHAFGQVANFHCDTSISAEAFHRGLNSLLPKDIVIRECRVADEHFHARYDVKSKTYIYRIRHDAIPIAIGRQYCWNIRCASLDLNAMNAALPCLIGQHDFKSFEGSGSPRSHTTRCVMQALITEKEPAHIEFEIEADGFLKFMVRNIMGTLVYVGIGKITPREFENILFSKDRRLAAPTAPPHGLFLMQVRY